jgi:hypothetical protein
LATKLKEFRTKYKYEELVNDREAGEQMVISKQRMPDYVEAALPELVADIIEYLELEESSEFTENGLALAGYYSANPTVAFLVYEYLCDDERCIGAIQLNPASKSFHDAAVFSWGFEGTETIEEALAHFLTINPPRRCDSN